MSERSEPQTPDPGRASASEPPETMRASASEPPETMRATASEPPVLEDDPIAPTEPVVAAGSGDKRGRAPMNPVLARELRIRLRGRRAWIMLTVYLLLLAGILFLVYSAATHVDDADPFSAPSPVQFASVGRSVFEWIVLFMLLLVLFLVPGFTSGAIAGERERQTLVPLQVTLLRPWQIVVGKLTASFAFLALLVVATAPFLGVAYLIGGVTIGAVLRGVGVVLFTGLVLAAITVCCSTVFRRVQVATVMSYVVVLFLLVGTGILWLTAGVVDASRGSDDADPPAQLLVLNPLFLAADVLGDLDATGGNGLRPFRPMAEVLERDRLGGNRVAFPVDDFGAFPLPEGGFPGVGFDGDVVGFDEFGNPVFESEASEGFPFWASSMIGLYTIAVAGGVWAVRRLRTPASIER